MARSVSPSSFQALTNDLSLVSDPCSSLPSSGDRERQEAEKCVTKAFNGRAADAKAVAKLAEKAPQQQQQMLLPLSLNADQWRQVEAAVERTDREFGIRRRLLATRLDASIGSFLWPERTQK